MEFRNHSTGENLTKYNWIRQYSDQLKELLYNFNQLLSLEASYASFETLLTHRFNGVDTSVTNISAFWLTREENLSVSPINPRKLQFSDVSEEVGKPVSFSILQPVVVLSPSSSTCWVVWVVLASWKWLLASLLWTNLDIYSTYICIIYYIFYIYIYVLYGYVTYSMDYNGLAVGTWCGEASVRGFNWVTTWVAKRRGHLKQALSISSLQIYQC